MPADGHLTGVAVTLTADQLSDICPRAPGAALAPLNTILGRTRSITDRRAAMLIAQLAVRSRSFTRLEEEDRARRSATVYFGRGWIQLTGLRRYRAAGAALALDLIERPELVVPHNAEVTAWYWSAHRLHAFSDAGDVLGCARAIDWTATRPRHLALLREIYERARRVLAGAPGLAA
ncbi:MAG TPA: glycoside hydrolase family 19 protein [Myxococcaceae bacterium]|nr:glycoside hydrolase family 19 protein [Myxococcaceae bacterium]